MLSHCICVSFNLYCNHCAVFKSQNNCYTTQSLRCSEPNRTLSVSLFPCQLFGALLRGCCADLSYLNLSKNSFSHRWVFTSNVNSCCAYFLFSSLWLSRIALEEFQSWGAEQRERHPLFSAVDQCLALDLADGINVHARLTPLICSGSLRVCVCAECLS